MNLQIHNYWFDTEDKNLMRKWIPLSEKDRQKALNEIEPYRNYVESRTLTFTNTNVEDLETWCRLNTIVGKSFKTIIGEIIALDQFLRTLSYKYYDTIGIHKEKVTITLGKLVIKIIDLINDYIYDYFDSKTISWEILFILMPLKHNLAYNAIDHKTIMTICFNYNTKFHDCKYFNNFYSDLCAKYYSNKANISPELCSEADFKIVEHLAIYEYFDRRFFLDDLNYTSIDKIDNIILDFIKKNVCKSSENICVSLSGGVDSMVMLYSLSKLRYHKLIQNNIFAIHINYGNRIVADDEENFVCAYCRHINVGVYTYNINFVKRSSFNRKKYEDITRDIRFECYRKIIHNESNIEDGKVFLGHIKDDVLENVLTNFATNKHINNLSKFKNIELMDSVLIARPLLDVYKDDILNYSMRYKIPYLLNTTPSWSNRGKFRNNFIGAFENQYGSIGKEMILKSAKEIASMANILDTMVIDPLSNTFISNDCFEIEPKLLDNRFIIYRVFENYFHKKGISKPSKKSIDNILNSLPCNRSFKIKKGYNVVSSEYKLTINQIS